MNDLRPSNLYQLKIDRLSKESINSVLGTDGEEDVSQTDGRKCSFVIFPWCFIY